MKSIVLSLVSTLGFVPFLATADNGFTPIDMGLYGFKTKSDYCARYIRKNPPPHDQVDYIIFDEQKAVQSTLRNKDAIVSIETSLLPAICQEVKNDAPPEEGFVPGNTMEMSGVAPAPTDFVMGVAGFDQHYSLTRSASGGLSVYGTKAAWGNFYQRPSDQKYRTQLSWKISDLLEKTQWQQYLDGKPVRLTIPLFYCTTDTSSYANQGLRPKFSEARIGEFLFRLDRPLNPNKSVEQYCFYFPNPVIVTLNSDGNSKTPEFYGKAKEINDLFAGGTEPNKSMSGWWSGRCYDINNQDEELNQLLVAGTVHESIQDGPNVIERDTFEMHMRQQTRTSFWSDALINERADYFDSLSSSQIQSISKDIKAQFKDFLGYDVRSIDTSSDFTKEGRDGDDIYRVRQVGNDYIARIYFQPNFGKFEDAEIRGVCRFSKKVN